MRTLRSPALAPALVVSLLYLAVGVPQNATAQSAQHATSRLLDVPGGKYAAFVLSGVGTSSNGPAFVTIMKGAETFEVAVAPATTTVISFGEGWIVRDREVTVKVKSDTGGGGVPASTGVDIWGATTNGPVKFPIHRPQL